MKLYNFKSIYSTANMLYGTTIDTTNFEDIALTGWELIGNKRTRLYKYTTNTEDKRIILPCNIYIIEAVYIPKIDAQTTHPYSIYPDVYNQWTEQYIESWKQNKNVFYDKHMLVKYREEGDSIVFDKDYDNITILYHGIIVDDEGLPLINDKELQALATYCAYIDMYKKSLVHQNGNLFQLAMGIKNDWLRFCNSARLPAHLSQNDMNDVLDIKTRWDRKIYGKSFKPIL